MSAPLRGLIICGSTRVRRVGPKIASCVASRIEARSSPASPLDITVLDPRLHEEGFFMRLLEKPLFHYKDGEDVPGPLQRTGELVAGADFFVVVSPEMNHTVSPGLVSLMSHFGSSMYSFKPSGIVTYSAGQWGGARAGVALRPFLSELGCTPVSSMVAVPAAIKAMGGVVGDADDVRGQEMPELGGAPSATLDRMLDQLEWQARTLKAAREEEGPPSESYFDQVRMRKPT